MWFLLGYGVTFGSLVALILLAGRLWPGWRPWLGAGAGLMLAAAGISLLRPAVNGHACRGPGGFLLRYSRWHPTGMGAAYAVYCATCCWPYLGGLSLLLAERGLAGGAPAGVLVLLLIMGAPVLAPVLFRTGGVQRFLSHHDQTLRFAASVFLIGVGLYQTLSR